MAKMLYFSGQIEVCAPWNMKDREFASRFPGIVGKRADSFSRWVGYDCRDNTTLLPITRKIEFKNNPSLHKCDSRCVNARGRKCECSCHGKNHGTGG